MPEGTTARAPAPALKPATPRSTPKAAPRPRMAPKRTGPPPGMTPAVRLGAASSGTVPGGEPLVPTVQTAMEESLQVDLQGVRVHSDSRAQNAAQTLSARAFAHGPNIFLGRGERATDLPLMAHEAAHVVQQQGAPTVQRYTPGSNDSYEREAHRASDAVVRGETFQVQQRTTPRVQRFGLSDILDWFADKANNIPGFRMFTIILGVNPINMSSVPRTAANILRALLEMIPLGGIITDALDKYGIFDKVGAFVEQQLKTLGMVGASIKAAISDFIDSLGWSDIFHLGDVWQRAKRIFTDPIDRIIDFGKGLVNGIIDLIKDAILRPLAKLAEGTQAWDLLIAVLGKNPITGDPVPRTAETLIGGFMKLIGQEEIWNNIKKANALARAWAWFQTALAGLLGFVEEIPSLFINTLKSLEIMDIVLLPRAFIKVGKVFGSFFVRFVSWAGNTIWDLLQIIFEVVAPGAVPYLKKVGAAFKKILKDPITFIGTLVKAGKLGFDNFKDHFGRHLKGAFLDWLTGSMPGIYIPKSFDFKEIAKLVLSVLGLTWPNIRERLVKATSETVVKGLELGFDLVKTLITEGIGAAWEKIKEQLSNLQDMVVQGIIQMITETVIKKAIVKVTSLLIPGAGFIQAIITIYDTIMVFIAKLAQIKQVAVAFLDSMMAIANGAIGGAAAKVESVLAGLLRLAISFLAAFAGLGRVADKVMEFINSKIRAPIFKVLDFIVDWIVKSAKALFGGLKRAAGKLINWWKARKAFRTNEGEAHSLYFSGEGPAAKLIVASAPTDLAAFIASKSQEAAKVPAKKAALKAIKAFLKQIESLSKLPEDKQEAKESEFKAAFNGIGDNLVVLLSDSDWGTDANPLPLEYPKRRAAAYPVLFFGPKSAKAIPQSLLAAKATAKIEALLSAPERAAWRKSGSKISKYAPLSQTPLPDGGPSIGISADYEIGVGKKVPYQPGNTKGGGLINTTLKPYGYRARDAGNDGDHIVEMQIGGPNSIANLWPLPLGENRSSGATLAARQVKKPDGTEIGMEQAYNKKGKKLWLMIVKTL